MNGKLHVEIGIDGKTIVSHLEGPGLALISAALTCVNLFYNTFEKDGCGEAFKNIFLDYMNDKGSIVWTVRGDSAEEGA